MNRLLDFQAKAVRLHAEVYDPERLYAALEQLNIPYSRSTPVETSLFGLLKAGASQIKQPTDFGFRVSDTNHQPLGMRTLLEKIESDWLTLAEADYERIHRVCR